VAAEAAAPAAAAAAVAADAASEAEVAAEVAAAAASSEQGLPLVNFAAQHNHLLRDSLGSLSG